MPGIVWWPGVVAPGTVSREVVVSLDLFPTFIELASAEPQQQVLDGFSITSLLRASPPSPHDRSGKRSSFSPVLDPSSSFSSISSSSSSAADTSGSKRNNEYVYYPQFPQQTKGLPSGIYAARSGPFKVHWAIQGTMQCGTDNVDAVCRYETKHFITMTHHYNSSL